MIINFYFIFYFKIRYSSIGTKKDTLPNLKLMIKKENGNLDYLPAYKLEDENCERMNRKKERS